MPRCKLEFIVEQIVVGPFAVNTYLVWRNENRQCLIIDPGAEGNLLQRRIAKEQLTPLAILLTHAHPDHLGALAFLKEQYQIPVYLHQADRELLENAPTLGMLLGLGNIEIPPGATFFDDSAKLQIGNFTIETIPTPGHTPGSTCFRMANYLFSGDTLFQGSVGRVDLPGGSFAALQDSLRRLAHLPDEICIYPGHGPQTTLGVEKATNPYYSELHI